MRLEPLYRIRFTTLERWSVELASEGGVEGQSFLIADGGCEGRIAGRYRAANFPRRRPDGTLLPDFRGALQADDGAPILFSWHGFARAGEGSSRSLVGSMTRLTDDERYRRLNDAVFTVAGEVRPDADGQGFEVAIDVAELVWEPLSNS